MLREKRKARENCFQTEDKVEGVKRPVSKSLTHCTTCGKSINRVFEDVFWDEKNNPFCSSCKCDYDKSGPFDPTIETNQLLRDAKKVLDQVFLTLYKKNSDYSRITNPYSNFEKSAENAHGTPQQGIVFRLSDKMERLYNLLEPGKTAAVKEETIEDTICDAIGYLTILYAFRMGRLAGESTKE